MSLARQPFALQSFGQDLIDVLRGQRGNRWRQDVAQHAAPPLEAQLIAIAGVHQRARRFPFDAAASWRSDRR